MTTNRRAAAFVAICFIISWITSIPALILYGPILKGSDFLVNGAAHKHQVVLGAVLELLVVLSVAGTAIGLFAALRKHHERLALGYLCFRVFEAIFVAIGIVAVLSLLTVSERYASAAAPDASAFQALGSALIAMHDWTFILGPNFMLGVNVTICSVALYRSRIVPRFIAVLGFTGATLVLVAALLEMFGVIQQVSHWGALLAAPEFAYEIALSGWLLAKGFNAPATAPHPARTESRPLLTAA